MTPSNTIALAGRAIHGGDGVTTDCAIQRIHRDAISNVVAGGAPAVLKKGVAAGLFLERRFAQT